MRKTLTLIALLLCAATALKAAPGDTTWVQAHSNIQLNHYGAFDSTVTFPSGTVSYRKVYMVFTLGITSSCPGQTYCHQWDYDVHNLLMTPGGDTLELSRFITPYATPGTPTYPNGWKYRYIFDVTDYYPLLKNSATMRIFYSGYSWGFIGDLKFAFVEGTPERNVLGITKLWGGSYTYGKASDPIDNYVLPITRTAPVGMQAAELKVAITGHGADPTTNCCEFASHSYDLKVNAASQGKTTIWRADCGLNEQYPQGGTWIYDRANWCPGSAVNVNSHKLSGLTAGTSFSTDLDFDAYANTANNNFGSYNLQGNLIYYGGFNRTTDASLVEIIAPTNYEGRVRENPSNGKPVISVRNSGSTTITSMQIVYGVKDSSSATYSWAGSLAPLSETQITLPELTTLKNMSLNQASGTYGFSARIASVNGTADNDAKNDTLRSSFSVAPTWPTSFIVYMKTNSAGESGVGSNPSETSWKITDANDNVVASRAGANVSQAYYDTVSLSRPGFYKFTVVDKGCDGLHWWVYDQSAPSITPGNIQILDAGIGLQIPLQGNIYGGTYHDDFGCGFSQSFTTLGNPTGIININGASSATIIAYPNPASNLLHVSLHGLSNVNGEIRIVDVVGRTILSRKTTAASNDMDIAALSAGIYNVVFSDAAGSRAGVRITVTK